MLSVLIYIPCSLLLGIAIIQMFGFVAKEYMNILGNQELMQQVRIPFEEIAKDVRYAEEIQVLDEGKSIRLRREATVDKPIWQTYQVKGIGSSYKIVKKEQPMVGNTELSAVRIKDCSFALLAPYKVQVSISGENYNTGHVFSIDAVLYSLEAHNKLKLEKKKDDYAENE